MAKPDINTYPFPLSGKLINSVDGMLIGKNFQTLKNLHYTEAGIRGVLGMTKINSVAIVHPDIKNGYHYRKPSESHILVQGVSGSTSSLYDLTAAIPGTGTPSELYVEDENTVTGYFSSSPRGEVIYCNSNETLIWPGDESTCAGFINTNAAGSYWYDYTDRINNRLQDAENIATIGAPGDGIDSSTMLMLHLNNNVTDDSPTTPHTVTNTDVTFDGADKVFGSHSAVFNGTTANFSVPDDPDFTLAGGTWTVDFRVKFTSTSGEIFGWQVGLNNFAKLNATGGKLTLAVGNSISDVFSISTAASSITTATWYHIAVVENGNNYYVFIDGVQKAYISSSTRFADNVVPLTIGVTGGGGKLSGKIDEFRMSNDAKWTSDFNIPTSEYASANAATEIYIGSLLPLQSFDFYIKTPNTQTSTLTVSYWNGAWVNVSNLSDGTSSGGASLAQDGEVSFDDTKTVALVKSINNLIVYWYKIELTAVDAGVSIYYATTNAAIQQLKDIWDGSERVCSNFQIYSGTAYSDNTLNVKEIDYSSVNNTTYADVSSLATSGHLLCGFNEQMAGINIILAGGNANSDATVTAVKYWDGDSWVAVSGLEDGTSDGTNALAKSGSITWTALGKSEEFTTELSKELTRYYYQVSFSAILSATVFIDALAGIPKQAEILAYNFPAHGLGRLWICKENYARYSSLGTSQVFNGEDSDRIYFGDSNELTASTTLYSQFGSNIFDVMVFTKQSETWALVSLEGSINRYQVSSSIGCVAPLTMQATHIEGELAPGINRNIAIWQGAQGVYMFDGRVPLPIHKDIELYFDRTYSGSINLDYIDKSVGFFNEDNTEYHWLFASGTSTTLDKELVFDVTRQRWYEIDRTKKLQAGFLVRDTNGVAYNYGCLNTGYIERLENGTDFDGDTISYEFQTGDVFLADELTETEARKVKLFTKSKTSGNDITITHYGDTSSTGTPYTVNHSGSNRILEANNDKSFKHHTLHSLKVATTNTSETIGFEPLHMAIGFKLTRRD